MVRSARALAPPLLAGLAGVVSLTPAVAEACGGTFCDGGSLTPMPVDQTGEDILFIPDAGELEVHVRIQYQGEAERFAWVVPLPSVPQVSVGSEPLFEALSKATIPVWSTTVNFEDPPNGGGCPPGGCLDLEDDGGGGPGVVYEEIIGAYEIVILDVDTAEAVIEFFDQNDYTYDAAAAPLIQTYLDEGSLITAIKLSAGATVDEIHPLVFRFAEDEPCIPLRLTAVAAREDMPVRAYFLGQERWAPSNFAHVVLNPLIYTWSAPSNSSYRELLALAVDEADGHGFVTEFAGSSGIVWTGDVWREDWTSAGFEAMDAHMVIEALRDKQLIFDNQIHPHVLAALRAFIPVPPAWGAAEELFWLDHQNHPQLIDIIDFDAPGFAAMLDERLFEPAMHAADLLDTWPYLTRLHTMISPEEMTLDPTFHAAPDLPTVQSDRAASSLILSGNEWARYEVPYGGESDAERERLCVEQNNGWLDVTELPRALRIEQLPSVGPAQVVVDNQAEIAQWAAANYSGSACDAPDSDDGGETGPDTDSGSDNTGEDDGPGLTSASSSACACTTDPDDAPPLLAWTGLLVLGLVRRR